MNVAGSTLTSYPENPCKCAKLGKVLYLLILDRQIRDIGREIERSHDGLLTLLSVIPVRISLLRLTLAKIYMIIGLGRKVAFELCRSK